MMNNALMKLTVEFDLPEPWTGKRFKKENWGKINFLVGPNGTGKTRFAEKLQQALGGSGTGKCRLLRADRLSGLSKNVGSNAYFWRSNHSDEGFKKNNFNHFKASAISGGFGGDAFIMLEEKFDLRIRVESILSQVFGREIRMEWDSGNLMPKAYHRDSKSEYVLHQDECHGIKELIVLLTHIYDDSHKDLIIDEPELNLHPQYQSFVLTHIKKVAASTDKKFFLITHSPFFIETKTVDSLLSILCFHSDFSVPSSFDDIDLLKNERFASLLTRLNTHHKQLFFAESPVFVEGIFDAQIFSIIQERRNVSMEGAGSCFIDVGGKSELVQYFRLIKGLGKKAKYILDLDALFDRNFRVNAGSDETVVEALLGAGMGPSLSKMLGELEKILSTIAECINSLPNPNEKILSLNTYLNNCKNQDQVDHKKIRHAVLVQLEKDASIFEEIVNPNLVKDALSKRDHIFSSLESSGIHILKRGFLENYLPEYTSSPFEADDGKKRITVEAETKIISDQSVELEKLNERYDDLFLMLSKLPSSTEANYKETIKFHISKIVDRIQRGIVTGNIKSSEDVPGYLGNDWKPVERMVSVGELKIETNQRKVGKFEGVLEIKDCWEMGQKRVVFSESTVAGNPENIILLGLGSSD